MAAAKRCKWNKKEQSVFVYRLGELLGAGYHLAEAIQFMQAQEKTKRKPLLDGATEQLRGGRSLYEVLSSLSFHPALMQFVYYAEYYGDLSTALMEGGDYWRKRNEDSSQILKILIYPLVLLVLITGIAFILKGVLLPKFESLYESMNIAPSFFLKIILIFSSIFSYFPYFIGVLLIGSIVFKKGYLDRICPLQKKRQFLRLPVLKGFLKMFDTYYLTYQMSGLISGGLSINESMRLFSEHNHHPFYRKLGSEIHKGLNEGRSLDDIFRDMPYFESYLSDVIANGQKNGKLDKELYHYSRILLGRLEEKMGGMVKVIQPVLFGVVGFIVIAIYLSVLLPMFSVMEGL